MKKYELLEKATNDYPKGTTFNAPYMGDKAYISTGVFSFYGDGDVCMIEEGEEKVLVYMNSGEWAKIVIQIKNKNECIVMTSCDGYPIFEGDTVICVHNLYGEWRSIGDFQVGKNTLDFEKRRPDIAKAFSTSEAAETWILEANKPKSIEVKLFSRDHHALIYKDQIELYGGGVNFIIKPSDLEDMLHAYQSLQQQSYKNKTTI